MTTDTEAVAASLGRVPRTDFEVVVRGPDGAPVVIRNAAVERDGTPMPTRYWLVDAALRAAVAELEASGGVRAAEAAVDADVLVATHERYAAERARAIPESYSGPRPHGGVGGTRRGVKCLHAHYAYWLAGGSDPVGEWVDRKLRTGARGPVT